MQNLGQTWITRLYVIQMTWPGFNPGLHVYVAMYCNLNMMNGVYVSLI